MNMRWRCLFFNDMRRYGSGGKSSRLAVGGLSVRSHPGRVEVSLSETPNPQLLLTSWLVPCMAANCHWCVNVCVNGWMRGIDCTALWVKALYKCTALWIKALYKCTAIWIKALYKCTALWIKALYKCTALWIKALYKCTALWIKALYKCTALWIKALYKCTALWIKALYKCTALWIKALYKCSPFTI